MTNYLTINHPLEKPNHFLELEVFHGEGGYNHFTNKMSPRGIKIRFAQVEKSGSVYSFQLFDPKNRIFHLETLKRRTHSVGKALAAFVDQHKEDLIDAALQQDWDTVAGILTTRRPMR